MFARYTHAAQAAVSLAGRHHPKAPLFDKRLLNHIDHTKCYGTVQRMLEDPGMPVAGHPPRSSWRPRYNEEWLRTRRCHDRSGHTRPDGQRGNLTEIAEHLRSPWRMAPPTTAPGTLGGDKVALGGSQANLSDRPSPHPMASIVEPTAVDASPDCRACSQDRCG